MRCTAKPCNLVRCCLFQPYKRCPQIKFGRCRPSFPMALLCLIIVQGLAEFRLTIIPLQFRAGRELAVLFTVSISPFGCRQVQPWRPTYILSVFQSLNSPWFLKNTPIQTDTHAKTASTSFYPYTHCNETAQPNPAV